MIRSIYLIGSLRNPQIPYIGNELRALGLDVFDDWFAAGEIADDAWRDYERERGHTYQQALSNHSARNVYALDRFHLNRAHGAVLALPVGRSGHIEAGFVSAQGKPVFALLSAGEEPERLDVMTSFFYGIYPTIEDLDIALNQYPWPKLPDLPPIPVQDALWLAGLLEGEGSFCISDSVPRLVLQMTDLDVVKHAADIFESNVWKHPPTKSNKQVWACGRAGLPAIEWMRILMPYLGLRRQKQIRNVAEQWIDRRKSCRQDKDWWARMFQLKV